MSRDRFDNLAVSRTAVSACYECGRREVVTTDGKPLPGQCPGLRLGCSLRRKIADERRTRR